MKNASLDPHLSVSASVQAWTYRVPFRIARGEAVSLDVVVVELRNALGQAGRGEAAGVDYERETASSMLYEIKLVEYELSRSENPAETIAQMKPGGARNALDCALWDLKAKQTGIPAWKTAGLTHPKPIVTAVTIGIGSTRQMKERAKAYQGWPLVKIKLNLEMGIEPVAAISEALPGTRFIVDPNQSWTIQQLNELSIPMQELRVALIEQPLPVKQNAQMADYIGPVPVFADESCTDRSSLDQLAGLFDGINIKLDKTGGLTEALLLAAKARQQGFKIMVGCMAGTSLAMAPAAIVAQTAEFVDLDGPLLHTSDRDHGLTYTLGEMSFPKAQLWG